MADTTLDGERILPVTLTCDMERTCTNPVAYIDNKGFVYCAAHGKNRQYSHPCRKLRPAELKRLQNGQTLARY